MGGFCQHPEIEALRLQLARWKSAAARPAVLANYATREAMPVVSSGSAALDRMLPEQGFRPGTLVEWLSPAPGDGAARLAFRAAAAALHAGTEACGDGRAAVVLDPSGEFYPPAAIAMGIEPSRLIVIHPGSQADHTWALDQVLRCPAVAVAVAWPDQSIHRAEREEYRDGYQGKLDSRIFRRLQLAVEQGGGLGLLIRPAAVRGEPSWADVRLLIEPLASTSPYGHPRRMRVVLLRGRGGRGEQTVEVEVE